MSETPRVCIYSDVNESCGNSRHPDGAWHPAAPYPASWEWAERLRQWWRRMLWGCGCPRGGA